MERLDGARQRYAWGSTTAIPGLLGVEPDSEPWAELWFGAHDAGPTHAGYEVRELESTETTALVNLDTLVAPDFPDTPASHHTPLPLDLAERLARGDWRAFGAWWRGRLVALTILYRFEDRWEVDRTAVEAGHRRRGLASAVKAASILTTHAEGARRWGTGGALANEGSLAVNRALGFHLEPAWHTLLPPSPAPEPTTDQ